MAEGGALLRRYVGELLRRGFESLLLRPFRRRCACRSCRSLGVAGAVAEIRPTSRTSPGSYVCDRPDDSGRRRPQRRVHGRQRLRNGRLQHVPGVVHARRDSSRSAIRRERASRVPPPSTSSSGVPRRARRGATWELDGKELVLSPMPTERAAALRVASITGSWTVTGVNIGDAVSARSSARS